MNDIHGFFFFYFLHLLSLYGLRDGGFRGIEVEYIFWCPPLPFRWFQTIIRFLWMLGMGRIFQHNFVDVFGLLKNEGNLILTSWRKVNYINNRPFHHSFIYGYSMYCTRSNCRKLWNYTQPRRYSLTEYRIECIYSSVFQDGIMARPSLDYTFFIRMVWILYYNFFHFGISSKVPKYNCND